MGDEVFEVDQEIWDLVNDAAYEKILESLELLDAGEISSSQHSSNMASVQAELSRATMTPEGSGTSVISAEELSRNEVFFTISAQGGLKTYQGRQPDNMALGSREAVIGVNRSTGDIRVAAGSPEAFARNETAVRTSLEAEGFIPSSVIERAMQSSIEAAIE